MTTPDNKPSLDELISERSEKAHECLLFAEGARNAGHTGNADAWQASAEYAMATVDYLKELRDLRAY